MRSADGSGSRLQNRLAEREALRRLIDHARAGSSGALVVSGEAGIGKTALLDNVVSHATGCRIVRAAGVESEMELAFAGLHQLCAPFLDRLDRLPAPQQAALATAFGLRLGDPPDRFLVGLAVLSLLSDLAEERPLVCILDDVQWLDRASAQVLGFVSRRLAVEAVAVIFAVREPGEDENLLGLPRVRVGPLPESDARALLASAIPGKVDEAVRTRIIGEAQGNPLALLELPRTWSPTSFAGGFGLPDARSVSSRIEESFRRRIATVSEACRLLLLLAAAEPTGDPVPVWNAAARLGIAAEEALQARQAGLLDLGTQVRFRHPLVRSVVYQHAPHDDRRRVHGALADVTDPMADPDRRAWHRAAAAPGPDDLVAGELEQSAARARARGGLAAGAAFLQRAVALSSDPRRRAELALDAAEASLGAGAFDSARELLAVAAAGPLLELGRARVDLIGAQIAFARDRGGEAPRLLLEAARVLETLDVRRSRDTYLEAWAAALFAGRLASGGGLVEVSRAAVAAPRPVGDPLASDLLLDGLARIFTHGRAAATPALRRAVDAFADRFVARQELLRWGWLATRAANYLWDQERSLEIGARTVELARDVGALEALAVADNACGQAAAFAGDFAHAGLLVAEVEVVRDATGTRIAPHAALALAGLRGREADDAGLIADVIREAPAIGQGTAVQYAHWARSVLMNGLGRHEEALEAATRATEDMPPLHVTMWALSELVEAATRVGNMPRAHVAVALLEEHTAAIDMDWGLGMRARARALVSADAAAEDHYREAIDRLERTALTPDLARANLLHGEWLRRAGRRVDAREHLRSAHEAFVTIGMEAFAERARRELVATGERVRERTLDTQDALTPQELQVAHLARDGLSNAEIGARLFLSSRTVEWHLRKVFVKLGVASRRDLRTVLPAARRTDVAV